MVPPKKRKGSPLLVDALIEQRVRDIAYGEAPRASAERAMANRGRGKNLGFTPSDDIGFISPYRQMAMARIEENELASALHGMGRATTRPGGMDTPLRAETIDTENARINAYELMRALKRRQGRMR